MCDPGDSWETYRESWSGHVKKNYCRPQSEGDNATRTCCRICQSVHLLDCLLDCPWSPAKTIWPKVLIFDMQVDLDLDLIWIVNQRFVAVYLALSRRKCVRYRSWATHIDKYGYSFMLAICLFLHAGNGAPIETIWLFLHAGTGPPIQITLFFCFMKIKDRSISGCELDYRGPKAPGSCYYALLGSPLFL